MARGNKNLAGLAALGALGYMLTRGKSNDDAGDQKTSSYSPPNTATKMADMATDESSYMPRSNRTAQEGVGDATNDPLEKPKNAAISGDLAVEKVFPDAGTPGGSMKRIEGRKPMPSLSAVERKAAARKDLMSAPASQDAILTDAMRNASRLNVAAANKTKLGMKRGGAVKKMASGGMTASRRGDGIASKGKTRGRMC